MPVKTEEPARISLIQVRRIVFEMRNPDKATTSYDTAAALSEFADRIERAISG